MCAEVDSQAAVPCRVKDVKHEGELLADRALRESRQAQRELSVVNGAITLCQSTTSTPQRHIACVASAVAWGAVLA